MKELIFIRLDVSDSKKVKMALYSRKHDMIRYKHQYWLHKMTKSFRLFGPGQAGDTIVEVVIAIAVIAVVLIGAFVVTNRSLTAVRDSQEHSEALNLLQGQVEQLRIAAVQPGLNSAPSSFCFNNLGKIVATSSTPGSACTQNSSRQAGNGVADARYSLAITKCSVLLGCPVCATNCPSTTEYILTANWPSPSGGTDRIQLTYRVFVN
jgi:Tfp pilus assembly protein PilV